MTGFFSWKKMALGRSMTGKKEVWQAVLRFELKELTEEMRAVYWVVGKSFAISSMRRFIFNGYDSSLLKP